MSILSATYDPSQQAPAVGPTMYDPDQIVMYVSSGIIPSNLFESSTQSSALRDAVFVTMVRHKNAPECLIAFMKQLKSMQDIDHVNKVLVCEFAATAAYVCGELNLTKEILMRVPPHQVTSYIKTLYHAIALRQWDSQAFTKALSNTTDSALNLWRSERQSLGV